MRVQPIYGPIWFALYTDHLFFTQRRLNKTLKFYIGYGTTILSTSLIRVRNIDYINAAWVRVFTFNNRFILSLNRSALQCYARMSNLTITSFISEFPSQSTILLSRTVGFIIVWIGLYGNKFSIMAKYFLSQVQGM